MEILNGEKSMNFFERFLKRFLPVKAIETVFQFVKCASVGVLNTLVDFAVLNILMWMTGIYNGKYIGVLIGISFCFAVTNSFIWNKKWTFKNKSTNPKDLRKQILIFFIISLGGLAIKTYSASFVINNIQIVPLFNINAVLWTKLWANIGNASAVFLTMVWNFMGYKLIVFKVKS